jgi:hypothetical protein
MAGQGMIRRPSVGSAQLTRDNDPINAQQFATQRPLSPEDLAQPLYDRVNYAAGGVASLSFFSQPIGAAVTLNQAGAAVVGKVKTYRDTNMENQGVVPTKRFTFIGMAINYLPAQQAFQNALTPRIADDLMTLKNGGWIEFRIVDKPLLYVPLNVIPESNPINSVGTTANNATMIGTGALAAVPYPMYKFAIPVTLNPQENFRFTINFDGSPAIGQATDIQVILYSFMRRPS